MHFHKVGLAYFTDLGCISVATQGLHAAHRHFATGVIVPGLPAGPDKVHLNGLVFYGYHGVLPEVSLDSENTSSDCMIGAIKGSS